MRICCYAYAALLFCLIITHEAAGQTVQHIFLDTTGDFGVDDNWSDPTKAPPETPTLDHNFYRYYINGGRTATISAGSPNGSHFQVFHLFPGDSPPAEPPSTGTLVMEGGVAPAPGEFGASLTVLGTNRLILGQRCNMGGATHGMDACTGGGEIVMNGASDILADGIVVGERDSGYLFIGPDARVRSGSLDEQGALVRQDFRIGSFGPSRGETEPIPVRLEGNGLVVVQGSLSANSIYMPESGATGELRVEGGDVFVRGSLDMRFEAFRASRSSKLSMVGSGGSFMVFFGDLLANHPTVTFSFTADANGVTPIVVGGTASPLGDFNDNGVVDTADYTVWRDTLGSTTDLRANDDNMGGSAGVIDQADYAVWKTNFGNIGERNLSTADIDGANLELDLDAYNFTPESRLLLIEAPADEFGGLLLGQFGNVTFLGNTTATVNYDMVNGDVYLDNFQRPAGSAAAVPEPGGLVSAVVLMACLAAQSRCRWTRNLQ